MACLAVIRIRGDFRIRGDKQETLRLLKLHHNHHAVLIPDTPSYRGMLHNVDHLVAWGEINPSTLATLLEKRARGNGGRRLTEEYVKSSLGYKDVQEFAQALHEGKTDLRDIHSLKPVFRLTPPSGGYPRKLKRHYKDKGEYGYRGEAINLLISRMC